MRKVAAYLLERPDESNVSARRTDAARIRATITSWLKWKGVPSDALDSEGTLRLSDGAAASYRWEGVDVADGAWRLLAFEQQTKDGAQFRTNVSISDAGGKVVVYSTLEAGLAHGRLNPVGFDPHCPAFVRSLLALSGDWYLGTSKIFSESRTLRGPESGAWIATEIMDRKRTIPIVVVSEDQGYTLNPGIESALARELAGLANVYRLDPEASWSLTDELGSEWSCYNGAIRLYWPGVDYDAAPTEHPLWTLSRLLGQSGNASAAASGISNHLRRSIMAASALSVQRPVIIDEIKRVHRQEELARQLNQSTSIADYQKLAEAYATENDRLNDEISSLRDDNSRLQVQLANSEAMRAAAAPEPALEPDAIAPPATATEALQRARASLSKELVFGDDVDRGVAALPPDAGPPEKILRFLGALAEAVLARRAGTLGKPMTTWLTERGVAASGESETTRNSSAEMKRRTWHDGEGSRQFELHMKPKEATDPASCVRIYFEWIEHEGKQGQAVVGWIGGHP